MLTFCDFQSTPPIRWRLTASMIFVTVLFSGLFDLNRSYTNLSHLCIPNSIYWRTECTETYRTHGLSISDPAPIWFHLPNTAALIRSLHTTASPLWEPHNGYGRDLWADLESMPLSIDKWLHYGFPYSFDRVSDATILLLHIFSFFFVIEFCIILHYSFFASLIAASGYVFSSHALLIFYLPEHTSYLLFPFVLYCLIFSINTVKYSFILRVPPIVLFLFSGHPESSLFLTICSYLFYLYNIKRRRIYSIIFTILLDVSLVILIVSVTYLPALFLWVNSLTHISASSGIVAEPLTFVQASLIHAAFGSIAPLHQSSLLNGQALYLSRYQGSYIYFSPLLLFIFNSPKRWHFLLYLFLTSLPIALFRPWGFIGHIYFNSYYGLAPFYLVSVIAASEVLDFTPHKRMLVKRIRNFVTFLSFLLFLYFFMNLLLMEIPFLIFSSESLIRLSIILNDYRNSFYYFTEYSGDYIYFLYIFTVITILLMFSHKLFVYRYSLPVIICIISVHFISIFYVMLIILPSQQRIPINLLTEPSTQLKQNYIVSRNNQGPYGGNMASLFYIFDTKITTSFHSCQTALWSKISENRILDNPCIKTQFISNNIEYSPEASNAFLDLSGVATIYNERGTVTIRHSTRDPVFFTSAWVNVPTHLEPKSRALVYAEATNPDSMIRINAQYGSPIARPSGTTCIPNSDISPQSNSSHRYTIVASCAGYFIRLQRNTPDWSVIVDGRKTTTSTADFLFQSVYVSAGMHFLEFVYSPPGLVWGFVFSLGTQVVLLFYFLYIYHIHYIYRVVLISSIVIFSLTIAFFVKIFSLGVFS